MSPDVPSSHGNDATIQIVLESVADAIVVADEVGHIQFANSAAARLFGYRLPEMVGSRLDMLMPAEVARGHDRYLRSAARDENATILGREREVLACRKNGEMFPVEITVKQWYSGENRLFTAVMRDLTLRKQHLDGLRVAKEQAEETARIKTQFLATTSHEIRTPMNGVLGMLELLRNTPLNTSQQENVDIAMSSGKSLMMLLNDILDLSRIEANKLDLENVSFNLRDLVDDVLALMAGPAREKGLDIACLFGRDLPLDYLGDPNRLRQIITNLIGNAVKFTAQGEIIVQVSREGALDPGEAFSATEPAGQIVKSTDCATVRFTVVDTGIGVSPKNQYKLFHAFQQAEGSTTRHYGGSGLGLAICKKLAEAMGGQIGVFSEPGAGARFWFTAQLAPVNSVMEESSATGALTGRKVVIAESRPATRSSLEAQASRWGMLYRSVTSGAELEKLVELNDSFDVLLVGDLGAAYDIASLPTRIRAARHNANLRVVMLSPSLTHQCEQRARSNGYDACVAKPVRAGYLFRTLCSLVAPVVAAEHLTVAPSDEALSAGNWRVLVVDDHPVNQKVAHGMLRRLGAHVEAAVDGQQALDMLAAGCFDLVLLDVQMPVMDGYEAAAAIRQRERVSGRHLPIIAMTAMSQNGVSLRHPSST